MKTDRETDMNKTKKPAADPAQKYRVARGNLLSVVLFTAVNMILILIKSGVTFLFSASIPQFLLYINMDDYGNMVVDNFFYICLAIAVVYTVVYLIAWIFSKKSGVWMWIALGLFVIDTVCLLYFFRLEAVIPDIIYHGIVIYCLISGIAASVKLKKMKNSPEQYAYAEAPAVAENHAAEEKSLEENTISPEEIERDIVSDKKNKDNERYSDPWDRPGH